MLKIRELTAGEVPLLRDFAPPDWKVDLSTVFERHFGQQYFHPIGAELDGRVVGCANGLLQGNAGWLGNIVVLPEFRGRGIGQQLTESLIRFFRSERVEHQILVATSMGEPIYRKLGFTTSSYYVFLAAPQGESGAQEQPGSHSCLFAPRHSVALFELDKAVTGESRPAFLRRYLDDAWVHLDAAGCLDGYYVPSLGGGLLIAASDAAGLELLRHRLSQHAGGCVVPEQNRVALDFLREHGFVETSRAPRMVLGSEIGWHPERVYCRGSGFCG